ncbi:GPW/gp25 family protein [Sphingobacterium paucimobilis]|uniref:IraD/Gp25-like domain-containing protein n=1 Tax=Sphingobacterium paucimobilis HER1398 TaxID=1346330 RepID=U2HWE8_9SPHI|nr:GPW/gp25 family protein [Sphingobacterium paucimobilis]ERJ59857.1 hypothetical protein M472_13885 [Sphingobacterium paucimobilis HER1398]
MTKKIDFLGRGWSFPPSFTKNGVQMSEYTLDVRESLHVLLSTNKGERIFRANYGSTLKKWVFSVIDSTEKTLIADELKDAISKGEPRITVSNIDVVTKHDAEGILWIKIEYIIRSTNIEDNLVFPFYLTP